MSNEPFEFPLRELLVVADGPPEAVWDRALNAAFSADAEASQAADPGLPEPDSATAAIDVDTGPDSDDDSSADQLSGPDDASDAAHWVTDSAAEAPLWDNGQDQIGDGSAT